MATRPQSNQLQAGTLALIGIALWLGVLAFGVAIWFVHRAGKFPVRAQPMALNYAVAAAAVAAVAAALALRGGIARTENGPERYTKILTVWSVGEGAALFGGVLFLLSNEAQWYALGLLAMLTVYVLVPLRKPT